MEKGSLQKVYSWHDLPSIDLFGGAMIRTGFRGDGALLTFNRIKPTMKRWEPHSHPFDQVVLTVDGRQLLEVECEGMECGSGTIVRVPADVKHTGWPVGDQTVLNIDIFAPPREDYLFLVEYQKEYAQPRKNADAMKIYHQLPSEYSFSGKMMKDTSDVLYHWDDLPKFDLFDGDMKRAGFRGDHCLLVFNWIKPSMKRFEPHSHTFDQIVLTMEGRMMLEMDGKTMECGPRSIVRVPAGVMHTGWPLGDQTVLNMDVFAPPREDYLFLVEYQKDYSAALKK